MTRLRKSLLIFFCLAAAPALAQTTIGSSTCNSSALNGTYEFILSGRQVTSTGATSKLFQAVGTAAFDGLSKVTLTMTANTVTTSQAFGTALVYSGILQPAIELHGIDQHYHRRHRTFTLESYNEGKAFAVIGSDATYAYNGTGNAQPATCPATLSGVHEFNANGSSLSGASVTGVLDVAGMLNFDGQGNVTANWTQVANLATTNVTATGTYTVNSTCGASATLTDSENNKYAVSISIYSTAPNFALAVSSPQLIFDGIGAAAQATTGATCSAATLNGTYELTSQRAAGAWRHPHENPGSRTAQRRSTDKATYFHPDIQRCQRQPGFRNAGWCTRGRTLSNPTARDRSASPAETRLPSRWWLFPSMPPTNRPGHFSWWGPMPTTPTTEAAMCSRAPARSARCRARGLSAERATRFPGPRPYGSGRYRG